MLLMSSADGRVVVGSPSWRTCVGRRSKYYIFFCQVRRILRVIFRVLLVFVCLGNARRPPPVIPIPALGMALGTSVL